MKRGLYIVVVSMAMLFMQCRKDPPVHVDWPGWESYSDHDLGLQEDIGLLETDNNGVVYCVTRSGKKLYRINGNRFEEVSVPFIQTTSVQHAIRNLHFDTVNDLWLLITSGVNSSEKGALLKYDGIWTVYDDGNGFPSFQPVIDFAFTDDGKIWMASSIGLMEYNLTSCILHIGPASVVPPEFIPGNDTIPDSDVECILADSGNSVWFGTRHNNVFQGQSALVHYSANNMQVFTVGNSGLPNNDVSFIQHSLSNKEWMICGNHNIVEYDGVEWNVFNEQNVTNLTGITIAGWKPIEVDRRDIKWFCTNQGLLGFDDNNWTKFDHLNSELFSDTIYSAALDSDGYLWIASIGGLNTYKK